MTMATTDPEELGRYRDKPIWKATGKFTNLGDGLSKAMDIEGGIDEPGTIVTFVVACRVGAHGLELFEDKDDEFPEEGYELTHTYRGGTVARIDPDLVRAVLATMETRIADAAKGQDPLFPATEGRTEGSGEGEAGNAPEELPRHLQALKDEDAFHDEDKDPGAANDLVPAGASSNGSSDSE